MPPVRVLAVELDLCEDSDLLPTEEESDSDSSSLAESAKNLLILNKSSFIF